MKKILIRATTDKGNESRISTDHPSMMGEIFYQTEQGGIRRVRFSVCAKLTGENRDSVLLTFGDQKGTHDLLLRGEPAGKLTAKG